jgi:hypothetical protein
MLKSFFGRYAPKQRVISEVTRQEAKQALEEIKKLGVSNDLNDLSLALVLISDVEKKFPFLENTAIRYRGEIVASMSKHPDFYSSVDPAIFGHKKN